MADFTDIIDPDNDTGTDYTSLVAWEANSETDHSAGAGDTLTAQSRSSSGTQDTAALTISGLSVDAVTIEGIDFPSGGIYDATKYVLAVTDNEAIYNRTSGLTVTVKNLQILSTRTGSTTVAYRVDGSNTVNVIDSCILKGAGSTNSHFGIFLSASGATLEVKNTTINGFNTSGITVSQDTNVYNCTISGCGAGITRSGGNVSATNCALFNNIDDISGTVTTVNCATDEGAGVGTNGVNISATWDSTCFTDTDGLGPDWSLLDASSPLYNVGADLSGSGVTEDIIGTARPQAATFDIGAFEFVGGAPPAGNIPLLVGGGMGQTMGSNCNLMTG